MYQVLQYFRVSSLSSSEDAIADIAAKFRRFLVPVADVVNRTLSFSSASEPELSVSKDSSTITTALKSTEVYKREEMTIAGLPLPESLIRKQTAAVLLELINDASDEDLENVFVETKSEEKKLCYNAIDKVLLALRLLVEKSPLSEGDKWLLLRAHELQGVLKVIEWLSDAASFGIQGSFEDQKFSLWWRNFWTCVCSVLQSPTFSGKAALKLVEMFRGDLRCKVCMLVQDIWTKCPVRDIHQSLVDVMIPPFTRLGLMADTKKLENVRPFVEAVLLKLLDAEIVSSNGVAVFEGSVLDTIDSFIANDKIHELKERDDIVMDFLEFLKDSKCAAAYESLASSNAYNALIAGIRDQVKQLIALQHEGDEQGGVDERIDATIQLMDFMEAKGRHELYERYLLFLIDTHQQGKNLVEAGNAMMMYAQSIPWGSKQVPGKSYSFLVLMSFSHPKLSQRIFNRPQNSSSKGSRCSVQCIEGEFLFELGSHLA
jgi:hypothetical protein